MLIHSPFIITSRLLPGIQIGEGTISIDYSPRPDPEGRTRYRWHVDLPSGDYSDDDLRSGVGGGSLQEGLASLLSFLGAAGESLKYRERTGSPGDNEELFPAPV